VFLRQAPQLKTRQPWEATGFSEVVDVRAIEHWRVLPHSDAAVSIACVSMPTSPEIGEPQLNANQKWGELIFVCR